MKIQQLSKKFKKNQSGRSMVEMLGVLAIIGVLSVGGIAGYKMAMEKNDANKISNFIQKMYLAMEEGKTNSNSSTRIYCQSYEYGTCVKERAKGICSNYLGADYCQDYQRGYYVGSFKIPNVSSVMNDKHRKSVGWQYSINTQAYPVIHLTNLKPSVCENVLSALNMDVYPNLYYIAPYDDKVKIYVNDELTTDNISTLCNHIAKSTSAVTNFIAIVFDFGYEDMIDGDATE